MAEITTANKETSLDEAYINLAKDQRIFQGILKESAPIIIRRCAQVLNASRVSIWLSTKNRTELVCSSHYSLKEDRFEQISSALTRNDFPEYFNALNSSRVIDAHCAVTDPRTKELADSYLIPLNIKSLLDATLRKNGVLTGVLCCEILDEPRKWTTEEKIFISSVADLVSQRLILKELQESEAHLLSLFEVIPLGIFIFDPNDKGFLDGNPAIQKIFKANNLEEILGKTPTELSPEYQPCGELSSIKAGRYLEACLTGETQTFEWVHLRIDGSEFDAEISLSSLDASRSTDLLFAVVSDISDRKKIERDLEFRASHDSLTGLPNRDNLHKYVNELIFKDQQNNTELTIALLVLDLNHFKDINDTFGHIAGDEALKSITVILKEYIDELHGRLFRLGGDEFVVVIEKYPCNQCSQSFEKLPENIVKNLLSKTIDVHGLGITMSASIGAAVYPDNGNDSHELLRCADVAMYYSKNNDSKSNWYDLKNDINNPQRLVLKSDLDLAIENDQLSLYFQPKIDTQTQSIVGFEALLRWQHPKYGLILPDDFLPLIELTEVIHNITDWVLDQAIDAILNFSDIGYSIPIAINISAKNILNTSFIESIQEKLLKSEIEPSLLEIEITETALINNLKQTSRNLNALDALDAFGVSIAIDDFGTGFSSLSHITSLPLDTIKIDPSFIQDMLKNNSHFVIVTTILNLAKNLSLNVVAEGVEDLHTFEALGELKCKQAQGFFIAKPMKIQDLQKWLKDKESSINGKSNKPLLC